jgi:predicted PurR-regulated permease PerM
MDENYFNKFITVAVIGVLFILAYLVVRRIVISLILGIILASVFRPLYRYLNKKIKSSNISAAILCCLLLLITFVPIVFLTPMVFTQTFDLYVSAQNVNLQKTVGKVALHFLNSEEIASKIALKSNALISKVLNYFINIISEFLMDLPNLFLQFLIVVFVFFYFLRDWETFKEYVVGIFPFSKEAERRFFKQTSDITHSIIYGQFLIGTIQGIIVCAGFYLFKVPNPLIWTIAATIAGILPVIGTTVIWLPIAIYIGLTSSLFSGIGIAFFGLLSNAAETFGRPVWVSNQANIHPAIVFIGMIGGVFYFGFMGFLLGPLILSYLFIVLDLYRERNNYCV